LNGTFTPSDTLSCNIDFALRLTRESHCSALIEEVGVSAPALVSDRIRDRMLMKQFVPPQQIEGSWARRSAKGRQV